MKRAIVAVVLLLLVVSGADAQLKFGAGAHLGLDFSSFPKPADQLYGMGFGFGLHGDMEIIKYVGVRFNFDYRKFASDKAKFGITDQNGQAISTSDISGLNVSIIGIGFEGLGKLPLAGSPVTPYGLFGMGLNISSASDLIVKYQGQDITVQKGGDSSTNFGIDFGVGSEFKIAKAISLYAEFKFLLIFSEGSSTSVFPLTVGGTFWF